MEFKCNNAEGEVWEATIIRYKEYGSHYYIEVNSRYSGLTIYFGRSIGGWFVCIPDSNAGTTIGDLRNINYNAERIGSVMGNDIDGFTVAHALYSFGENKGIEENDNTQDIINMFKSSGFEVVE